MSVCRVTADLNAYDAQQVDETEYGAELNELVDDAMSDAHSEDLFRVLSECGDELVELTRIPEFDPALPIHKVELRKVVELAEAANSFLVALKSQLKNDDALIDLAIDNIRSR